MLKWKVVTSTPIEKTDKKLLPEHFSIDGKHIQHFGAKMLIIEVAHEFLVEDPRKENDTKHLPIA